MPADNTARDDRVISLLTQLGDQLLNSERERATLAQKVAALEAQQAANDDFTQRIHSAIVRTDDVHARIESALADRAKLLARLETIESSVEDTQQILRSRSLVPFTEQLNKNPPNRQRSNIFAAFAFIVLALAAGIALEFYTSTSNPLVGRTVPILTKNISAQPQTDSVATFLAQQKPDAPPSHRLSPDPSLPPVAKQIESRAFAGNAEAQHDLAALYTSGQDGIHTNYARAAIWFREAALAGVANARYNLGVMYQQGLGVPKDLSRAVNWYRAAAALGHPEAEYNLGIASVEGFGTPFDPVAAAKYFRSAALAGIGAGAYNLGLMDENGLAGAPDKTEALYWYSRAATLGSREGGNAFARLSQTLGLTPDDAAARVSQMHPEIPVVKPSLPVPPVTLTAPPPATKDAERITAIEQELMTRHLYPGPADGVDNPALDDAIRSFEQRNTMTADGKPTDAVLDALKKASTDNTAGPLTTNDKTTSAGQ